MALSRYDVLIIGAGQAGIPLAYALAEAGRSVALAERQYLGGSCVNFGCTPTKAVLASARVAHLARRAGDFGVRVPTVEVDFPSVMARARAVVEEARTSMKEQIAEAGNPALLRGHARFEPQPAPAQAGGDGFRVRVGDEEVAAAQVVLDVGTRTLVPPIDGLDNVPFLDAGSWLGSDDLPEHLVMIGGGAIGLEMAQLYRRMGSRVTVVEGAGQVLPDEDEDVAEALRGLLEGEGIAFHTGCTVERVAPDGDGIAVTVKGPAGREEIAASHLFLAAGRRPNTDDLGLEHVGIETDEQGFIGVDERLSPGVAGLWVAGDARGWPMFTHTAWDDHRVILSQMTGDGRRTTDRVVPYAVFTDPALGRVGMTERAARAAGRSVKVARYDMAKNGKARETGETAGFVKVVVNAHTDELLGAAVLAVGGAELVHAYIALMNAGAPYTALLDAVLIHPTRSEAVQSVLKSLA